MTGFAPPPYPYDELAAVAATAAACPGGAVDLSVGTPGDPPPPAALAALASGEAVRGYPPSAGTATLRQQAAGWLARRFGVAVEPDQVAACVGTKEFVASTAWYLRLRTPGRDTVLHPAVAYPTYAMGARLAGCRAVGVPPGPDGGVDLAAIDEADAERALCLWVNSPANPSGALDDLPAAAAWGRARGVPVLSDECYAEFTWPPAAPATVLSAGTEGVLAVHSVSKRSNLAGLRVGFYAGDPDLVDYLREVRKHAGLMVPGPAQAAAAAALADDVHVDDQRARYHRRLDALAAALSAAGVPTAVPAGGFYLWPAVPAAPAGTGGKGPDWALAQALAEAAGVVASPGSFYGDPGHVRLAVVAADDRIDLVCARLAGRRLG